MKKISFSIVLLFLFVNQSFGQVSTISAKEWATRLCDPDKKNKAYALIHDSLIYNADTSQSNLLLKQLDENGNNKNLYFLARLNCLKVAALHKIDNQNSTLASKDAVLQLMKAAMQHANESNDDYLATFVSQIYFSMAFFYNETELAVTYSIYAIELNEKLFGTNEYGMYHFAGELMYRVREYEKCKDYSFKWLTQMANTTSQANKDYRMAVYNTIALAYHRTGQYDSAILFYQKALVEINYNHREAWKGILAGNIGQVYYLQKQYDTAKAMLESGYPISIANKYYDDAANSLQWAARTNVALGNKVLALQQVRQAMQLIKLIPDAVYQQNIYEAATDIFKINGLADSAVHYSRLYQLLHDSLEKKIATSSLAISNMRLSEEKNRYNIRRMQEEKKAQVLERNFIILGIVFIAFISVLIVNRQRLKLKYRQESLEKEKKIIETEMLGAKQQMEMFTQNIIEKTTLIEKLEEQMQESNASTGQQETITVLSGLTILTEDDWGKFKQLFEKIYPLFFQKLKTLAPDITVAEQRMAALTKLQLTTRQMASMQGISPDSVHKTRQRLRQRLGLSNEVNLEQFFTTM